MRIKSLLVLLIIIFIPVALTGWKSILVPYNQDVPEKTTESPQTADILYHSQPIKGVLEDLSPNGHTLLVFSTSETLPITNTIELVEYNQGRWSAASFLSSEKTLYHGVFSLDGKGIYYTETASSETPALFELVWTDLNRSNTRVLTRNDESIITAPFSLSNGAVLYGNDSKEIVQMQSDGTAKRWHLNEHTFFSKVTFLETINRIVFTAADTNDGTLSLYTLDPEKEKSVPLLIDTNITDYDIDPLNGNIYYLRTINQDTRLCCYYPQLHQSKTLLSGDYRNIKMAVEGNQLAVITPCQHNNPTSQQRIILINTTTRNLMQLTAPNQMINHYFIADNTVFYTVNEEKNGSTISVIHANHWK